MSRVTCLVINETLGNTKQSAKEKDYISGRHPFCLEPIPPLPRVRLILTSYLGAVLRLDKCINAVLTYAVEIVDTRIPIV